MHPNQSYATAPEGGPPREEHAAHLLLETAFLRGPLLGSVIDKPCENAITYSLTVRHGLELMSAVHGPDGAGHWLWRGARGRGGAPTFRFTAGGVAQAVKASRAVFDVVRGLRVGADLIRICGEKTVGCVNPFHHIESMPAGENNARTNFLLPEQHRAMEIEDIPAAAATIAAERGKWVVFPEADDYRAVRRAWYEQSGLPVPPAKNFPWEWD